MWEILADIVILLSGSFLFGAIASRFGQNPLVGYLLAGMVLGGPGSLQIIGAGHDIEAIAEVGVALLLFSLGLEFSLARLKSLGQTLLIGSALQITITFIVVSGAVLLARGHLAEAVVIGAMISLSSTAVVLRTLSEEGDLESLHGRNSLAILLMQDIAVVPFSIVITLFSGTTKSGDALSETLHLLFLTSALILFLYFFLNKVAVKVLESLSYGRNRELTIVLAIAIGLGSTWAAHAAGVSPALGAFVAGIFLGASPFSTQIRADIAALRVVLLTLFFSSAGMLADPLWMMKNFFLVAAVTIAVMSVKTIIISFLFRSLGQHSSVALSTGICLSQIGEFSLVIGSMALSGGIISHNVHLLLVSSAIASLFLSPILIPRAPFIAGYIGNRLKATVIEPILSRQPTITSRVIVIGFGPTGQIVAESVHELGVLPVIIDSNSELLRKAASLGYETHLGDATQYEVLAHAHIDSASIVIITVPHQRTNADIVKLVRQMAPNAHVAVRARYASDKHSFTLAGAHAVFGDELEVGNRLASHLQDLLRN
ncbi:MAG: cation:proton antiporter [bacterium]|nr:cation:proton antiporter [bacterium]